MSSNMAILLENVLKTIEIQNPKTKELIHEVIREMRNTLKENLMERGIWNQCIPTR